MRAIVFVLSLVFAQEAAAQAMNPVSRMIAGCRDFLASKSDFASGQCAGVAMTLLFMGPGLVPNARYCPPDAVTLSQIVRMVLDHVDERPQLRQQEFMLSQLRSFI